MYSFLLHIYVDVLVIFLNFVVRDHVSLLILLDSHKYSKLTNMTTVVIGNNTQLPLNVYLHYNKYIENEQI